MLRPVLSKWLKVCIFLGIMWIAAGVHLSPWEPVFGQTPGLGDGTAGENSPVKTVSIPKETDWTLLIGIAIAVVASLGNLCLFLFIYVRTRARLDQLDTKSQLGELSRLTYVLTEDLGKIQNYIVQLGQQIQDLPGLLSSSVTEPKDEPQQWEELNPKLDNIDESLLKMEGIIQRLQKDLIDLSQRMSNSFSALPSKEDSSKRRAGVTGYYSRLLDMAAQKSQNSSGDEQYIDALDFVVSKLESLTQLFPQNEDSMIVETLQRARSALTAASGLTCSIDRLVLPGNTEDLLRERLRQEAEMLSDPARIHEFGGSDVVAEEILANPTREFERCIRKSVLEAMNKTDSQESQSPKAFLLELRKKTVFELLSQIENRLDPYSVQLENARAAIREILERIGLEEITITRNRDCFNPNEHKLSGEVLVERPATGTIVSVAQMGVRNKKTGEVLRTPGVVVAKNPSRA